MKVKNENKTKINAFNSKDIRKANFSDINKLKRLTPSRTRVTISEHAGKSLDYINFNVPCVLGLDPNFLNNRPETLRFCIQFLAYLANSLGINDSSDFHEDHVESFFFHAVQSIEGEFEALDLSPSHNYHAPDITTNLTFIETQDDDFLLLKSIFSTKGVRSNNHLVEEIIYSIAATVSAMKEGYYIDSLPKSFSIKGFGDLWLKHNDYYCEGMVADGTNNVFKISNS